MKSTFYSCPILIKFVFFRQIFEKRFLTYQISLKPRPVRAHLSHADGQTGRTDEPISRFSQFCERALK